MGVMDDANFLPNDLAECQRLLLAAFREATQRERRLVDAERRAAGAERNAQAAERRALSIPATSDRPRSCIR